MSVEAVRPFSRLALLSDGTTVPVTNMFDADGDETDDPYEAVTFVAGEGDRWFTERRDDYEEIVTQ